MLIKSGLITQGSGSLGGVTLSHNRGGLYLRGRTIPTDPNTSRQQVARAAFTALVVAWTDTLTQVQRDGWTLWAQNTPFTGPLGDPLVLTGQQAYIYANQPRLQTINSGLTGSGLVREDVAPVTFNTGEVVNSLSQATVAAGPPPTVTVVAGVSTPASAAGTALLFWGRPQNAARVFYKGPYQLAAVEPFLAAATTVTFAPETDDPAQWATVQVPTAGQFVPAKVVLAFEDGRISTPFRSIISVV